MRAPPGASTKLADDPPAGIGTHSENVGGWSSLQPGQVRAGSSLSHSSANWRNRICFLCHVFATKIDEPGLEAARFLPFTRHILASLAFFQSMAGHARNSTFNRSTGRPTTLVYEPEIFSTIKSPSS